MNKMWATFNNFKSSCDRHNYSFWHPNKERLCLLSRIITLVY